MQPIVLSGGFNSAWTDIDQASTKYLTSVYFVNTNLWYFLYCFFLVSLQFSCNLFTAKPNNAREGRPRSVLVPLVTPCDTFTFLVKRFAMVSWSTKVSLTLYFKVSTKVWIKVAEHSFRARFCWCNSPLAQGFQKTNMSSIERSFYLLNTRTICIIFLYNWKQCIDGFKLLLQR